MPSAASRSPSEFPLTAQTDWSHSSPGHDDHDLDDHGDDDHGDALDDDKDLDDDLDDQHLDNDLDEYFSTEEMRRACLLSPVSDTCPDLWENF